MSVSLLRPAGKAGTWYPGRAAELAGTVDALTAMAPADGNSAPVAAGLVPHAGLAYSGAVAARVFAELRRTRPATPVVVFLGAVHTAWLDRPAVWPDGAWETPLGSVAVDAALAAALTDAGLAAADPAPHVEDNAIELQLPFVRRLFPEARIVPVAVPPLAAAPEWGRRLAEVLRGAAPEAAVIASSDLTHYGPPYGFAPAGRGEAALRWAMANDRKLLETAANLEAEALVPLAARDRSACGAGALAMMTAYARALGCPPGEILCQTTSHDLAPEEPAEMFVGYGALVFRSPAAGPA